MTDKLVYLLTSILLFTSIFSALSLNQTAMAEEPPEPADSDNDGMPDGWEDEMGLNKEESWDAFRDFDGDGFRNLAEYVHNTHPRNETSFPEVRDEDDSDGDGVCNFGEYKAGADWNDSLDVPMNKDTDGDGLSDVFELGYGDGNSTNYSNGVDLNPINSDTDRDGAQNDLNGEFQWGPKYYRKDEFIEIFNDGDEVKMGSNPLIPNTAEAFENNWVIDKGNIFRDIGSITYENGTIKFVGLYAPVPSLKETGVNWGRYPASGVPSVRYGWILLKHNWLNAYEVGHPQNGTVQRNFDTGFEIYYNMFTGGMQIIYYPLTSSAKIIYNCENYLSFRSFIYENETLINYVNKTFKQSQLATTHWYGTDLPLVYLPNQIIDIEFFGIKEKDQEKYTYFHIVLERDDYANIFKHELGLFRFETQLQPDGNVTSVVYKEEENRIYYPAVFTNNMASPATISHKLVINPYYLQFLNISNMKVQSKVWLYRYDIIEYYDVSYVEFMNSIHGEYPWEEIPWNDMILTESENNTFYYEAHYPISNTTNQEFNMTFFFLVNLSLEFDNGPNSTAHQEWIGTQFAPEFAYKETVPESDEKKSFFAENTEMFVGISFLSGIVIIGMIFVIKNAKIKRCKNPDSLEKDGSKKTEISQKTKKEEE